jgi:3-hydroxyisobutyrate dehydrogenase
MEIAFLGTGIMGLPMARHIAAVDGHTVRAWNRTREKAEPLREHGVEVVEEPGEAVTGADVVVTMLADGPATVEVATAMLPEVAADTVWWQAGTVGLNADRELAGLARAAGVDYVDGPVLGTRKPAEQGELIVLSAGSPAARHRCGPLFAAVGSKTVFLGEEPGAGSRLKLVLNHWIAALTAATAETIVLARALGVEPQSFLDTIAGGPLDSGYAQLKGGAMLAGAFSPPSFPLKLAAKDVRLVLDAARDAGQELALAPAALTWFERAEERGHGDEDMAAVILGA